MYWQDAIDLWQSTAANRTVHCSDRLHAAPCTYLEIVARDTDI